MTIRMPDEPQESFYWSRKFEVFSISRLYLSSLGFPVAVVNSLTDEDLQFIADELNNGLSIGFDKDVKFAITVFLTQRDSDNCIGGQGA